MTPNKIRCAAVALVLLLSGCSSEQPSSAAQGPCIVNIVNFIRAVEPRSEQITREVLRRTVEEQIDQLNRHQLPATFLLQYDALIDTAYQQLLKGKLGKDSEIGAWWEITQPHVEAAGMVWRGRYPWDWHADVGFATGYTPQEREKLTDVYMEQFKSVFGYYPASVGSWFIDAHTLGYMYDKYGIKASCNCKDQYGTDGYTLWGGYWNQAYYPSRVNAYMPAQNAEQQIDVPVFRMLGSDPLYQYDMGLGTAIQGVASLEPVYHDAGGDPRWVDWFLKSMSEEPSLAFNYIQAGQENSFTWDAMRQGLAYQIPQIDSLQRAGKLRVETLRRSGEWFREQFPVTPATAVTALSDFRGDRKTVWYNSRFYRANLLWEGTSFRFRDIHLFDERFESDYLHKPGTTNQCVYTTLPLVDGFLWSTPDTLAGLSIVRIEPDGGVSEIPLGNPRVEQVDASTLRVTTSAGDDVFEIVFREDCIETACTGGNPQWMLQLRTAPEKTLPFTSVSGQELYAQERGFGYTVRCTEGTFASSAAPGLPLNILPEANRISIDCKTTH